MLPLCRQSTPCDSLQARETKKQLNFVFQLEPKNGPKAIHSKHTQEYAQQVHTRTHMVCSFIHTTLKKRFFILVFKPDREINTIKILAQAQLLTTNKEALHMLKHPSIYGH